jgi:hypothetical protein
LEGDLWAYPPPSEKALAELGKKDACFISWPCLRAVPRSFTKKFRTTSRTYRASEGDVNKYAETFIEAVSMLIEASQTLQVKDFLKLAR